MAILVNKLDRLVKTLGGLGKVLGIWVRFAGTTRSRTGPLTQTPIP